MRSHHDAHDDHISSDNDVICIDSDSSASESKHFNTSKHKRLTIQRGMQVLALDDPIKHIWKTATIKKIKSNFRLNIH